MSADENPDELLRRLIGEVLEEDGPPPTAELAAADQVRAFIVELAGRFDLDLTNVAVMRAVTLGVLSPGLYITATLGVDDALEEGREVEVADALALCGFVIMALYEETGRVDTTADKVYGLLELNDLLEAARALERAETIGAERQAADAVRSAINRYDARHG